MAKTYRIAHLEHKLSKARELLSKLIHKLPTDCSGSVWVIVGNLRHVLAEDEDADVSAPPAGEEEA